jgi:3-oxoacyl-[acyl-carrier-protein] synthase II
LAALKDSAGVQAEDIEYVNAHATGTPMGDDIELRALTEMVARGNKKCVPVSSSKGGLGHLLGAAGSIEAAISVLALFHRSAPPNVNLDDPIPHDGSLIHLNREPIDLGSGNTLGAVLSTSFGFGGVNTALIFTRAPS